MLGGILEGDGEAIMMEVGLLLPNVAKYSSERDRGEDVERYSCVL